MAEMTEHVMQILFTNKKQKVKVTWKKFYL